MGAIPHFFTLKKNFCK